MQRSTKYTIKKGKVLLNKPAKPKVKLTGYEKYLNIARDNGVPKSEILTKEEYNTVVVSNKQRNIAAKPDAIVRQQLRDGITDKQYRAAFHAAKHMNPNMTRKKFTEIRGWESIDSRASKRYEELKAIYHYDELREKDKKKYTWMTTMFANIISTEIYGSE